MEPWQVWCAELDGGEQLMLIVSSAFHLRINVGRLCVAVPVVTGPQELLYQTPIKHPGDGETYWVHADMLQLVTVPMAPTGWTLGDDEINTIRKTLKHMVDF